MPSQNHLYAGIDAGSVSINCVVVDPDRQIIFEYPYTRHFGKAEECVQQLINQLYDKFGQDHLEAICFTGNHGKTLSEKYGCFYEFESICQVLGAVNLWPEVKSIISMGGQDTALFQIEYQSDGWELKDFSTNGPCASGTGSFIDQQAERLATSIYSDQTERTAQEIDKILADFIVLGQQSKNPSNVACRCTVFTKSDMIHLQNKGEKLSDIIYGLHIGNARNYLSTIVAGRQLEEPLLLIGGMSLNQLQVRAFREYYPNLAVPEYSTSVGALGVALQALQQKDKSKPQIAEDRAYQASAAFSAPIAPALKIEKSSFPEDNQVRSADSSGITDVYLGIDIGSTSTKNVVISEQGRILQKQYLPTQGRPIEAVQRLLSSIRQDLGPDINIAGVAATGSGRNVVGDFLNADLIIDEITAHASGAIERHPQVDTIFEIGGQDSKYISVVNTFPLDFDMNKVCAAGTGSFLHELANKYGVNIVGEFQDIALRAHAPVKLAERCTVFMETDLVSFHQKGVPVDSLLAGLCYAIVHNYLNRVVGKRPIGKNVMFLGGPSLNKAIVAAFEKILDREIIVPRHREVMGAIGAAVQVKNQMLAADKPGSSFRGLDQCIADSMNHKEIVCHVDPDCHNECKLKVFDFEGRKSIWGGDCGRYEGGRTSCQAKQNYFLVRDRIWQKYLQGVSGSVAEQPLLEVDGRPTVGMQTALYTLQTAVLWAHFFDQLGMRLLLTPATNSSIVKRGIETTLAETCFPLKVSHGHIDFLAGKTSLLFLPSIIDMPTPSDSENGFFCPMIQGSAYMQRAALNLAEQQTVLSPVIHLRLDPETLSIELAEQLSKPLKASRSAIKKALLHALEQQRLFNDELVQAGRQMLEEQSPQEPVVIVTGRPYNLYDQRLNLRLGAMLAKLGITALPMDLIDVSDIDLSDFPSMYWGLGAQILRTTKLISRSDNYFGLHLTNFSCGADSFIEHFFKYEMNQRPYLILELDEHSAVAGVMTRLEAFSNVLKNASSGVWREAVNLEEAG